jgi:hypothetical protein
MCYGTNMPKRTTARLAAFAAVLAAVFGISALAGGAVGPEPKKKKEDKGHGMAMETHDPAGLSIEDDGYRLSLLDDTLAAGRTETLRFRILDESGRPATDFPVEHGARLHLIVVRRDLTGYQHLHPRLGPDGTWSIALTLPEPGAYRAYADFHTGGKDLTLGADLFVPGGFEPKPLPAPATTATADGYSVELTERSPGELRFTVNRDGREVSGLQPYLGAREVALREGDLAYLHAHADEEELAFTADYPSAGRYRLYLQFKHEGRVHRVEYTREVAR